MSLSLSANPEHLIKGTFSAATKVFTEFFEKISKQETNLTNIAFKGLDVVRQYAALLERHVQTGTRARKALVVTRQANPLGRSMIEMLGVLAIIGVLSVGGIAGYSKAMEKFKINKTIEQYSYLVAGMIGNVNEFKKLKCKFWEMNWQECGLRDYVLAANLVPADWHSNNAINQLIDSNGNMVNVFSRNGNLVMDFHIGGFTNNDDGIGTTPYFPVKLCRALMSDLAQPLHSVVEHVKVYKSGTNYKQFYGDAYCGGDKKCLNDITLAEINDECHGCEGGVQSCTVTLEF